MQNKVFKLPPTALTTAYTTNILSPPTVTGGVNAGASPCYIILRQLRIINKLASSAKFRLYLGATGANAVGTEVIGFDTTIAANSYFPWVGYLRIDSTDFLVGGADTTLALVIQAEGEIGVSG